jgi:spermidine/putrescine-binding protein
VTVPVESWGVLWDPRYRRRVLMLDDPREAFMAALKWKGHSLNTTDPDVLARARDLLIAQKPLVRAYNSTNFEDVLLSGDVWLAQAWNGQIAKAMDQDPDIAYVIPREGATLFIDNLAIPADARQVELAHAFIDFTMEPEIAAEICRTMRYSSPNRAALPLLPEDLRRDPAVFPPREVLDRLETVQDVGEATVTFDRMWTEIKTAR